MSGAGKFILGTALIIGGHFATAIPVVGPVVSATLVSAGVGFIRSGLSRSLAQEKVRGIKSNITSTQAYLPVVYGECRVGFRVIDTRVIDSTDPDTPSADPDLIFSGADDNDILCRVGAFCLGSENGSGVDEIDNIRFDERRNPDAIATNLGVGLSLTALGVNTPYVGLLKYTMLDGSSTQTTPSDLQTHLGWPSTSNGYGVAYIALYMLYDEEVWGTGIPNVTAKVRGNRVYDPRDTPGWAWSDNPALCILDYLTSKKYGAGYFYPERDGGDTTVSEIDEQSFIDAANYCDDLVSIPGAATEKRFTCNGAIDTSRDIITNLNELLSSCRGSLVWQNGKIHLHIREATTAATLQLTEENILGGWEWVRRGSRVPNVIEATYLDGIFGQYNMNSTIWPEVGDTTYVDADGGFEVRREIELPFTVGEYRAKRIAMVTLKELRQDVVVTVTCTQEALELEVGDVVQVTHTTPGWTQKEFWVVSMGLQLDGTVRLGLVEYDSAAYSLDSLTAEVTVPGTNLPNPFSVGVPTSFTATSGATTALVTQDDDIVPRVLLEWVAPAGEPFVTGYQIQQKLSAEAATEWKTIGRVVKEDLSFFVTGVTAGEEYDFRIRAVNTLGVFSDWVSVTTHTVSTVDVSKIVIVSEGLRSAGINVANNQIWNRVLELYAYPGVVSFHIQIDSWEVSSAYQGTTTVGPIDYDINLSAIGVTAGQSFTHVIEDGAGSPYEFDIKYDDGRILTGYDFGHTIRVTPYDATGGESNSPPANPGTERVVTTKKISEYDSVGIRTEEDVYAYINRYLLLPGSTLWESLGGGVTYSRAAIQYTTPFASDLDAVQATLRTVGSPTGTVVAKVYSDSSGSPGSVVATSDTVDVSGIGTSAETVTFVFSTPYAQSNATVYHYSIEYTGGDASNYLQIGYTPKTVSERERYDTGWGSVTDNGYDIKTYELITIERFGRTMTPGTNLTATLNASGQVEVTASGGTGGATDLDGLSDVVITGPVQAADYLRHNGTNWVDSPIQTGDITQGMVTQHEGAISHDNLSGFVAAEHIDWSVTGAEDVHPDRLAVGTQYQIPFNIDGTALGAIAAPGAAEVLRSVGGIPGWGSITSSYISDFETAVEGLSADVTGNWTFAGTLAFSGIGAYTPSAQAGVLVIDGVNEVRYLPLPTADGTRRFLRYESDASGFAWSALTSGDLPSHTHAVTDLSPVGTNGQAVFTRSGAVQWDDILASDVGGASAAERTFTGTDFTFSNRVIFGTQHTASADITGDDVQLAFEWKPAHTTNDKVTANFFSAYQTATNAGASARLIGIGGYAYIAHPDNTTYTRITGAEIGWGIGSSGSNTGDITTAEALFIYGEDYGLGSGTIGTLYHIRLGGWLSSATTPYTVTTEYGIYIPAINTGATAYAIYTNAGAVSFGDDVTLRTGAQMIFAADGWDPTAVSSGAVAQIDNATLMGYTGTEPRRYSVRHIWDALDLLTAGTPTTSEYIPFYDTGVNAKKVTVANLKTAFALTAADIGAGTFPSGSFTYQDDLNTRQFYQYDPTTATSGGIMSAYFSTDHLAAHSGGNVVALGVYGYGANLTTTTIAGIYGAEIGTGMFRDGASNGTISLAVGASIYGEMSANTSGGVITDLRALELSLLKSATSPGTITTGYALKIEDVAGVATTTYAIHTGTGDVRFGDQVEINTSTADQLTLVGAAAGDVGIGFNQSTTNVAQLWFDDTTNQLDLRNSYGSVRIRSGSGGTPTEVAVFNHAATYDVTVTGSLGATVDVVSSTSDRRLKTDLVPVADALTRLSGLRPYDFAWKEGAPYEAGTRAIGLIAQDVQAALPQAVHAAPFNDQFLTYADRPIVALLVGAIQELHAELERLRGG